MRALERSGVTVFVDLTHPSDPLEGYDRWLDDARRIAHPIPDMGTPTAGHVIQILDDIDAVRADGGDRLRALLGRRRADRERWSAACSPATASTAAIAIARIAELRRDIPGGRPSPETAGQAALVRGWRQGR